MEHSQLLYSWSKNNNPKNKLEIIMGATHTFNTKHPFTGPTPELENLIAECIIWIKSI